MEVRKYVVTSVSRRDEWDSRYGKMQDYAIALEGEDGWIKLTQKFDTRPPEVRDELQGYIENKSNSDGSTYRKFKKENPQYSGASRSDNTASSNGSQMSYIIQMLEELTGRRDATDQIAEVPDEQLEDPFAGMNI